MSDVLLRGLPEDDVAELKAAAQRADQSLQAYLRDAVVHGHVVYLRRVRVLAEIDQRLAGRRPISDRSHAEVWAAVDAELGSDE